MIPKTKIFRIALLLFAASAVVIIAGVGMFNYIVKKSLPKTDGEIKISAALGQDVTVIRDRFGVPHIYGKNAKDTAFALGFVHAQDRLWQMELLKFTAEGRLSEMFGEAPLVSELSLRNTIIEQDKFMRVIGFRYIAKKACSTISGESKKFLDSYVAGVNAFIKLNHNSLPIEFLILRHTPSKWYPEDIVAIGMTLSWGLTANWDNELIRYLISQKAGMDVVEAVLPKHRDNGPFIIDDTKAKTRVQGFKGSRVQDAKPSARSHLHNTEHRTHNTDSVVSGQWSVGKPQDTRRETRNTRQSPNHPQPSAISHQPSAIFRTHNTDSVVSGQWSVGKPRDTRRETRNTRQSPNYQITKLPNHQITISPQRFNISAFTDLIGSNNWVVSGKLTKSGKPILANDPHLSHMLPSIFYAAHLHTGKTNVTGVTFPGLPFVLIGHNDNIAWGATTTVADTTDLFIEKRNPDNPNQYLYKGKWLNFKKRSETIYVKENGRKKSIRFEVLSSIHGPVINSIFPEFMRNLPPVTLNWAGFYAKHWGESYKMLAAAKGIDDFKKAISMNEVPIQNWIFADKAGNIGYFPCGLIPIRKNGDGVMPVEGWTGEYDWIGFIPPSEIPQIYNPKKGFIVTANNKVISQETYKYVFSYDYSPYYRAARITQLLAATVKTPQKLTIADMKKIQMDEYSIKGERLTKYFISAYEKAGTSPAAFDKSQSNEQLYKESLKYLKEWDFSANKDSIGATIFFKSYAFAAQDILGDELGDDITNLYLSTRRYETSLDNLIEEGKSPVFDDKTTTKIENRDIILSKSFEKAVDFLHKKFGSDVSKWQWGKLHTMTFSHPFGAKKPLDKIFCKGPIPLGGERNTVNMAYFPLLADKFAVTAGPALRFVIDMSDIDNAEMVIDTGQSGNLKSKHYLDQAVLWLKGKTSKMLFNRSEIEKEAEGKIILKAKSKG